MKKILLSIVMAATALLPATAETMTVGGTSYTVNRTTKQLASGVTYTELLFPGRTYTGYTGGGRVHVIEADLTSPNVKLEMVNNGTMSGTKTLANHAAAIKKSDYIPVAGANANFWITSEQPWKSQEAGQPHGVAIRNGSMFTDPNVKTDAHCGGPTVTGMLAVDNNGKVYIDRTKPQLANNAPGSGVAFQAVNTRIGHAFDLDQCNRVVQAGTASIYNRNYGTSKKFRPVNTNSSGTWDIVEGLCTELILDLAAGEKWNVGGITKFVLKEIRTNAGTGTLGDHDLAIVGRDSYATVLANNYQVGDPIELNTTVTFESLGSPGNIAQAISGNILAMKDGVNNSTLANDSYCKNANERTLYATNANGTKLWILVCEHNVAQSKQYFGWSTAQMCDIAKTFGATNATQVDCGGSAQMWTTAGQVSQSYDTAGIRGVYNGLFVVSTTAPVTETETPTDVAEVGTSVNLNVAYADQAIADLSGYTIKRLIAKGDYAYILGHKDNVPKVIVYDTKNKQTVRTLGTANCKTTLTGNTVNTTLSDIALTDDGVLVGMGCYAINYLTNIQVYTYKWSNATDGYATGECVAWNIGGNAGNWYDNIAGEAMTFNGSSTNGNLFFSGKNKACTNIRWVRQVLNSNSQLSSTSQSGQSASVTPTQATSIRMFKHPSGGDKFIVNGGNMNPTEITFVSSENCVVGGSTTLFTKTNAATEVFKHGNDYYMVGATPTGITLANITSGLASAKAVTVNATPLASNTTANNAASGTTAKNADGINSLVLLVIRDNKLTRYEQPSLANVPKYNGERANFAYALKQSGDKENGYTLSYKLTGKAKAASVVLVDQKSGNEIIIAGGTAKGLNSVKVAPADLDEEATYSWRVEVDDEPILATGQFFAAQPAKSSRGGVGIVTNPESDAYGRLVVSNGCAQGFDLYEADLTKIGNYCNGAAPLVAANRSDTYRLGMRDGMVAYASAFSNAGAGFWRFDPANPSNTMYNLSGGTNDGTGRFTNGKDSEGNDIITGSGSPTVTFTGTGASTSVWTFAEDWPTGDSSYKGILTRWDIGNADKITNNINAAYARYAGAGTGAILLNQNCCLTGYGDGVFIGQLRGSGANGASNNSKSCPSLVYVNKNGTELYNSGGDHTIPVSGSAVGISADGSLLALSGCQTNIRIFNVTWSNGAPSLTFAYEIDNSANSGQQVCQIAFDPANNVYAYFDASDSKDGLHVYAIKNANPHAVTPAKVSMILEGPDKTVTPPGPGDQEFTFEKLTPVFVYSANENNLANVGWFNENGGTTRDMCYNDGKLYVLNTGGQGACVNIVEGYHPQNRLGQLNMTGISGGSIATAGIRALGNTIVMCNMASATAALKVYAWDSDTSAPRVILNTTNHGNVECGRGMSVSGDMNNGKLIFGEAGTNGTIVYFNVINGEVQTEPVVITHTHTGSNASNVYFAEDTDGSFYINHKGSHPAHLDKNGNKIANFTAAHADNAKVYGAGIDLIHFGGHKYVAATSTKGSTKEAAWGNGVMNLIDVTDGVAKATNVGGNYPANGLGPDTWGAVQCNTVTHEVTNDGKNLNVWTLVPHQGVSLYEYSADGTGIGDITVTAEEGDYSNCPVELFNLQGIRVDAETAAPGVYIKRQGKHSEKVVIR